MTINDRVAWEPRAPLVKAVLEKFGRVDLSVTCLKTMDELLENLYMYIKIIYYSCDKLLEEL